MDTLQDCYSEIFKDTNRILVVLAHPDDMEINCGGLIARLAKDNKKVRLVVTTNGGKGVKDKTGLTEKDFAQIRVQEQMKAGKILGIKDENNINLQIPDGEVELNLENIRKIALHIRQFRPDIVITHRPEDTIIRFFNLSTWINHRDHRNTALLTIDAIYPYSRDRGFFPEQLSKNSLAPHTVTKLLLADSYTKPEIKYFGINNFLEQKKLALQQHVSAFSPEDADDYIEENKYGSNYFEPLGYYEVY